MKNLDFPSKNEYGVGGGGGGWVGVGGAGGIHCLNKLKKVQIV